MRLWTIAAIALLLAAGEPVSLFADIPNVTVISYEVEGRNPAAVRQSIDKVRPTDPNDGKRSDGLSRWQYQWSWQRDERGKCTVGPEDLIFSATITVPRLADSRAPTTLRAKFDRYLQSLLAHENGHIRYAWDHRGEIIAAMNTATCATADAAGQAALKAIAAHDIADDKATGHGSTTILPLG